MRGSKITKHSGAQHGLGGKSIQKGTLVGKQQIHDSLDQNQPLMQLTFGPDHNNSPMAGTLVHSPIRTNQSLSPKQQRSKHGSPSPHGPSIVGSQARANHNQYILMGMGSPHLKSIASMAQYQNNLNGINVDLHRLGQQLGGQAGSLPNLDSPHAQRAFLSSILPQASSRVKKKKDDEIDPLQTINRSQSTLKAILLQNMSMASGQRSSSRISLEGSELTNRRQDTGHETNTMPEETRLDPRPIQTQEVPDTPQHLDQPSELTSNPSQQYFDHNVLPIHTNTANSSLSNTGSGTDLIPVTASYSPNQKLTIRHGAKVSINQQAGKVPRMQVFDLHGIQKSPQDKGFKGQLSHSKSPKRKGISPQKQKSPKTQGNNLMVLNTPDKINSASQASFAPFQQNNKANALQDAQNRFVSQQSIGSYQQSPSQQIIPPSQRQSQQVLHQLGANIGLSPEKQHSEMLFSMHQQTFGHNFGNVAAIPTNFPQQPNILGNNHQLIQITPQEGQLQSEVALIVLPIAAPNFNNVMDIRENSRGAENDQKATNNLKLKLGQVIAGKHADKKISLNRDSGHTINEVVTNKSATKNSQLAGSTMEVADAAKQEEKEAKAKQSSSGTSQTVDEQRQTKARGTSVMQQNEQIEMLESASSSEISIDGHNPNKRQTELHHGQPTSPNLEQVGSSKEIQDASNNTNLATEPNEDFQVKVEHFRLLGSQDVQPLLDGQIVNNNAGQKRILNQNEIVASSQQNDDQQQRHLDSSQFNELMQSKLNESQAANNIEPDQRTNDSAGSVERALHQIEAYGLDHQFQQTSTNMQDQTQISKTQIGLVTFSGLGHYNNEDPHRKSPRLLKGQGQASKQTKRELLPLATVNIMSGAVTLEQSSKHTPRNPPASPFMLDSPDIVNNNALKKQDHNFSLSPLIKADEAVKKYNKEIMNRTVLVEPNKQAFLPNQTMHQNSLFSNIGNVRVDFRETGQVQKMNHHNPLLRTTYGLRDEASSDTVSTEHNYLSPTVHRMGMKQHRASMITSEKGSNIHVQEHNITPEEQDLKANTMKNVQIFLHENDRDTNRQQSMINQESQVMMEPPSKSPLNQSDIRKPHNKHALIKSQLSKAKLAPLSISPNNTMDVRHQAGLELQNKRSVSKLSIDLRDVNDQYTKKNTDHEMDTALLFPENQTVTKTQNSFDINHTPHNFHKVSSMMDSPEPKQRKYKQTDHFKEACKIDQDELDTQIMIKDEGKKTSKQRVTRLNTVDFQAGLDEGNRSGANSMARIESSSSKLLQDPSQGNGVSQVNLTNAEKILGPTKVILSNQAPYQPDEGQMKSSRSKKLLNETVNTAAFQPKELKLFEPDLDRVLPSSGGNNDGANGVLLVSQSNSPLALSKDASKNSLQKQMKKKTMLPRDTSTTFKKNNKQHLSRTVMKQAGTQMSQTTDKIQTIDVRDRRLQQPSILTQSSKDEVNEQKSALATQSKREKTNQSFATVKQTDENPSLDNMQESKMSRFMPAVFSTAFSQTYVDLLKNVSPYDVKSEVTDSEAPSNPLSPTLRNQQNSGLQKHKKEEGFELKMKDTEAILNLDEIPFLDPTEEKELEEKDMERIKQNPELQFYLKVLERMRINHKDVVSVDAVKKIGKNYKKYIATQKDAGKGLFKDLECQKIEKPTITLSNDDSHDPLMLKFKIERSINKQYNIAAIKNQETDSLPRRWKKLSPINRAKAKHQLDAANKRYSSLREKNSNQVSQSVDVSQRVAGAESTRNMFKSMISSQEFDSNQQFLDNSVYPLPNFEMQPLLGDLKRETHMISQRKMMESPLIKLKQPDSIISQSVDIKNFTMMGELNQNKKRDQRQQNLLSIQGPFYEMNKGSDAAINSVADNQNVSVENLDDLNLINEESTNLEFTFVTQQPEKPKIQHNATEVAILQTNAQSKESPPDVKSIQKSTVLTKKQLSPQQTRFAIMTHNSVESKDPAAYPTNPQSLLDRQKSQFADLLTFGKGKKNLKDRVGPNGHNPFLDEIEDRLKNPEGRQVTLEKALVTRYDPKEALKQFRPKVQKDKTIKIATGEIYDSIRVKRGIPSVPLHRMDKISRNLTESLLEKNAQERIPMRDWQTQEVMLPILNTAKRNVTLHTSVDLCMGDIQRQRLILDERTKRRPNRGVMRSLEPLNAEAESNRAGTQLSMISLSTPVHTTRPTNNKLVIPGTFNNPMLRKATERNHSEHVSSQNVTEPAKVQ